MSSDRGGSNRRSRLLTNITSRLPIPNSSDRHGLGRRSSNSASLLQPLAGGGSPTSQSSPYHRASSPTYSEGMSSSNHHGSGNGTMGVPSGLGRQEVVSYRNDDDLVPPVAPFVPSTERGAGAGAGGGDRSNHSSRRSSLSFLSNIGGGGGDKERERGDSSLLKNQRPSSLSLNYVPAKFTRLHAPGDHSLHRRTTKQGGGRDAFAKNASRMGEVGTVDDDEGVVFQLGKGGLRRKNKPKLRWNRFKWVLFVANTVVSAETITCGVSRDGADEPCSEHALEGRRQQRVIWTGNCRMTNASPYKSARWSEDCCFNSSNLRIMLINLLHPTAHRIRSRHAHLCHLGLAQRVLSIRRDPSW